MGATPWRFKSSLPHHFYIQGYFPKTRSWWNGRHATLRGWWEKSRMGSNPIDRTKQFMQTLCLGMTSFLYIKSTDSKDKKSVLYFLNSYCSSTFSSDRKSSKKVARFWKRGKQNLFTRLKRFIKKGFAIFQWVIS